ncbi:MAG: 4-cresol dehydrogenase (hydroxylating) [Motiliproteus sp.]|jgi:4-cresol dehydrogenase (hydroxylating)
MIDFQLLLESCVAADAKVLDAEQAQQKYGKGTEGIVRKISAAVIVKQQQDIGSLLLRANELADTENAFVIYPVSSGHNWGYGSALPASDALPAVIVDLSQLKAIPFFDKEAGLVTVEPGVTQADLRHFLDQQGAATLMVPVTGAGPGCSILGNALERGYGITPHTDHFAAVTSLKAYLPTGEKYQSALCELDLSGSEMADKCYKWGLGPYLDGLFTQSGFGVVTEMSIRLREKPSGFDSFYLRFAEDSDLEVAVDLVAAILKEQEGIVGSINLMDRRRVISMIAPNPNGPQTHRVMTESQVAQLAKKHDIPAWTAAGSIYGTQGVVAAARKDIKRRLRGIKCQAIFSSGLLINAGRMAVAWAPSSLLKKERGLIKALDKGIEVMQGIPNEVAMPLCYWRTERPEGMASLDPARDSCGLFWYAPLVPMKKAKIRELVELVRTLCTKHNIEPMVTLTNFRHDCSDSTIPIVFNMRQPDAVRDARNCLNELLSEGLKIGLVPYRLNIEQQGTLLDADTVFWKTVGRIHKVIDPGKVLMRGRYGA